MSTHTGVFVVFTHTHTHTHTHHYIMIISTDNDRILDVCGTGSLLTTGLSPGPAGRVGYIFASRWAAM